MTNDPTFKPQTYQDDFDANSPDEFSNEATLSPATELGIPQSEYKQELDKIIGEADEDSQDAVDRQDLIEDMDDDQA